MSTSRNSEAGKVVRLPSGEARWLGPHDPLANERVHAVGADHRVSLDLAAVGEGERDARPARGDGYELLAEMDAVRRNGGGKRRVQVAAMENKIRRAITLLGVPPERMIVGHRADNAITVERGGRRERDVAQVRLEAEAAMHLHGVGTLLNPRADAQKFLRLLVDRDIETDAPQRRRGGEPADAGADNGK